MEADDEDRTNPTGLFNTAVSYWKSAAALERAKVKATHPDHPIRSLYYHAIELYLKAFLRQHHSVKELASKKFGHNTKKLSVRARELELSFHDEDQTVFAHLQNSDAVMQARYIRTGLYKGQPGPPMEALDRTCRRLHKGVGQALKTRGLTVRL